MKLFEENIDEFISKPVAERIRLKELVCVAIHLADRSAILTNDTMRGLMHQRSIFIARETFNMCHHS